MKILFVFRQDVSSGRPVQAYPHSFVRELETLGHDVTQAGEGHTVQSIQQLNLRDFDLLIEMENGRNREGKLEFQCVIMYNGKLPSILIGIDQHGNPDLHRDISPNYDHVFFAVWRRRDLFTGHESAHWCPNSTDPFWFDADKYADINQEFTFGFHSSKGGIYRAARLVEICQANGYTYDVRTVTRPGRHRWPMFPQALAACSNLFNCGQKHDGPNLRVLESMAMRRPLLNDIDELDGMSKLFEDGVHYIGYHRHEKDDLEEKVKWLLEHRIEATLIARRAHEEVMAKHTVRNRVQQILEVVGQ